MNYQEIEQAFIKADDLAQKGDKQAFEDAQYFAQILHSRLKEQEPSMLSTAGKNLVGGAAATGDFFGNMIPDAISGVGGLAAGAVDAATSDRSFLDSAADMTREIQNSPAMSAMRNGLGKLSGTEQSGGYKAATEALEIPAILGKKAIQGWQALGRLPIEGLDSTVNKLQNPEADPLGHVVAEAGGPLLGYPLVGKGARKPFDKLAENTVKSEYKKPEPLDSYKQEESAWPLKPLEPGREWGRTLSDIEYPRKDLKGELKEGEDLTAFYPEGIDQPKKESTIENLPPLDIDLLPERVSKDTVVKGMVTQWNNTQSRLREIYQKANELGLEGTRVRSGELGTTKKSKTQINALRDQISSLETKLNNIAKQLQRRMEVKHNFVYDEGWTGAPLYSGAKTHLKVDDMGNPVFEQRRVGAGSSNGKMKWTTEEVPKTETETGVFSDVPPSVKGPAERTTGLEVEKSTTPNMQRSPDADVTGAEMVAKTPRFVPKRQRGSLDPEVFKEGFKALNKHLSRLTNLSWVREAFPSRYWETNSDGTPKILLHGSSSGFDDTPKIMTKEGLHVGYAAPAHIKAGADKRDRMGYRVGNVDYTDGTGSGTVYPVVVRKGNYLNVPHDYGTWNPLAFWDNSSFVNLMDQQLKEQGKSGSARSILREWAKDIGERENTGFGISNRDIALSFGKLLKNEFGVDGFFYPNKHESPKYKAAETALGFQRKSIRDKALLLSEQRSDPQSFVTYNENNVVSLFEPPSGNTKSPLGGVGKKQGGAIDPTIFKDLFPEFDLSKFKDELGKLLPLYHGTSKDKAFSDFKNSDRGIWVTDNPKDASSYAFENDSKRIKYNADSGRFEPVNNSPRVHQVYVNAQNIYKPTALEMEQYRTAKSYSKAQAELMKKAKALGYDAIDYGGGVYAIADSSQIKSAISPDVSPKRGLNKGPGGKQSGGVNFGISEKIADLLTKSRTKTTSKPNGKPSGVTANFYEETRDAETFFKEELPNASSWKDIPTNLLNNFLQGRAVANLARHSNPLVRYIVHKTVSADRVAKVSIENALWGDKFVQSMIRGVSKRVKSDNGILTYLDKAKFKDADKLKQTLLKFDNAEELIANNLTRPTEEMLRREGLSTEQVTAANAIYDGINKVYNEVNKVLKAAGKEEIKALPGYIPHMWFGDYRVVVKDPVTKETLDIRGVDNRYQANALKKALAKRYGDKNIEMFDASKNKYKANDLSAFEYATRILSKDSPERKIIEQVYKDVIAHRGFKTHALKRKGTPGFAGAEPGRQGLADFQKALEVWTNQGYHFIANEKKRALFADVTDRLSKLEEKPNLENTEKFINEYTQQATGGLENQLKLIDNAVEAVGDLSGLGPSAPGKMIGTASGLASFFWLTTVKNLGVNLLQPAYAIPKLLEIKGSLPDTSSVTRAMAQGFMESFVPGTLSSKSRKGLDWARENGFIESKTLELIKSRFNKANLAHDFAYNLSKHTLGVFEQEAVRTPTFIAFDVLLRDTIKDDKQRWQTAGALTDQYMVDYGRTESPLVFSKAGDIIGDSIRPLKQYSASYFGQLAEYAHLASTDKRFAPLAAFLGVQVVLSGLMGIPGFQTANSIIRQINEGTGSNIKTPEDILLTSGMSDTFIWGPVSKVTGIDISKSVGAPGVEDFITAPGLSFMAGVGKGAINMASEGLSGTLSSADIMKDVGQMIPNPHVQAGIEKANQLPSGHIPDPNNRMLPKYTNPRSDSDMMKRLLTGGQLLKEQEEKAIINSTRGAEQHRSKVKAEIMEKFIDDLVIQRKGKISPELLKEYVAEGGDPRNLSKELTSYLKDSLTGRLEREILNSKGLSQVEKIESLKKYKTIIEGLELEQLMGIVSNE